MSKYDPLYSFLKSRTEEKITLSFEEIENMIGFHLPDSAYHYSAWWSNSGTSAHPYCRSWLDANYKTANVEKSMRSKQMVFKRFQSV